MLSALSVDSKPEKMRPRGGVNFPCGFPTIFAWSSIIVEYQPRYVFWCLSTPFFIPREFYKKQQIFSMMNGPNVLIFL